MCQKIEQTGGGSLSAFLRQGGVGVVPKKIKQAGGGSLSCAFFLTKVGKGGGLGSGVGVVPANLEQPRGWQLVSSF